MPLDNLESFLKEKIAELDETLPPEISWNKEQGWQQLQVRVPAKRPRKLIWYRAAAVTILLICALLLLKPFSKYPEATPNNKTFAGSKPKPTYFDTPADIFPTPVSRLNTTAANSTSDKKLITSLKSKPSRTSKRTLARLVKKNPRSVENARNIINSDTGTLMETTAEPLPPSAALKQEQIKITVVLGGKSRRTTEYIGNNTAKANRRKSKRLKLQVSLPGEMLPEDSSFTATANQVPNRSALSARIDF